MIKISVIIPVYKVERYLDECVQSVLSQTYTNLEIILVDDGSPDNCPSMCDNYAIQDSRVYVIHKENGGLSDARNAGLLVSEGEYVVFLDSDDYWQDNDFIASLVEELARQPDVDMILFGRKDYYESSGRYMKGISVDVEKVNGKEVKEAFRYLIVNQLYSMSAWSKLIKRDFLISNQIMFEKGLLGEDMDWSLQLWLKIKSVRAINIFSYIYRHHQQSITTTYNLTNVSDFVSILKKWQKIAQKEIQDSELKNLVLGYLAFLYPTLLRFFFIIQKSDRKIEYELIKQLIPLLQYSITKKSNQIQILNKFMGFNLTIFIIGVYGLLKKKGIRGLKLFFK